MLLDSATLLETVMPHLPPELISAQQFERCLRVAMQMPEVCEWGGFELRLGDEPGPVDLGLCVQPNNGGVEKLARIVATKSIPTLLEPASRFLHAWLEPGSALAAVLDHVWFEFDLPDDRVPPPFVYPGLARSLGDPRTSAPVSCERTLETLDLLAPPLLGRALGSRQRKVIEEALQSLPAAARVNHAATLQHRGRDSVRLAIGGLGTSVIAWLHAVGWRGDRHGAEQALALCSTPEDVNVLVDFENELEPSLGVFQSVADALTDATTLSARLGPLLGLGLCSPRQAIALVGFVGHHGTHLAGIPYRVDVQRHVGLKVQVRSNGRLQAKAYLTFFPSRSLF